MSYYVIKGPESGSQYLCAPEAFKVPQWYYKREEALRFADEGSAWNHLAHVQKVFGPDTTGSYLGRVVRVNTIRDLKAHRELMRSEIEGLRLQVKLKAMLVDSLEKKVRALSSLPGSEAKP